MKVPLTRVGTGTWASTSLPATYPALSGSHAVVVDGFLHVPRAMLDPGANTRVGLDSCAGITAPPYSVRSSLRAMHAFGEYSAGADTGTDSDTGTIAVSLRGLACGGALQASLTTLVVESSLDTDQPPVLVVTSVANSFEAKGSVSNHLLVYPIDMTAKAFRVQPKSASFVLDCLGAVNYLCALYVEGLPPSTRYVDVISCPSLAAATICQTFTPSEFSGGVLDLTKDAPDGGDDRAPLPARRWYEGGAAFPFGSIELVTLHVSWGIASETCDHLRVYGFRPNILRRKEEPEPGMGTAWCDN